MSADNGYVIRQNDEGKYVLQMYFASADEYPPIDDKKAQVFEALHDAVLTYGKMDREAFEQGYPLSEYGLSVHIDLPKTPSTV